MDNQLRPPVIIQLQPGDLIASRYEICERIGVGGMGMVYKVIDRHLNEDVVALKLLHPHLAQDEQVFKRFLNEVLVARALSHPNIVRIHDIGRAEGGFSYISMEFVDGVTLKDWAIEDTAPRQLTFQEGLALLFKVLSGVGYAHERGVIHRDLKPANIMISKRGEVKLADFGTARIVGMDTSLTQTGQMIGTPDYMSPEQVRGDKLDARSDIYSLGIIAYELSTGTKPFVADSAVAVAFKHLNEPMPNFADATKGIPFWYQEIVQKAAAKDRNDRFQSVAELAQAIGTHSAEVSKQTSFFVVDSTHFKMGAPEPSAPADATPRNRGFELGAGTAASTGEWSFGSGSRESAETSRRGGTRVEGRGRFMPVLWTAILLTTLVSLIRFLPPLNAFVTKALPPKASGPVASFVHVLLDSRMSNTPEQDSSRRAAEERSSLEEELLASLDHGAEKPKPAPKAEQPKPNSAVMHTDSLLPETLLPETLPETGAPETPAVTPPAQVEGQPTVAAGVSESKDVSAPQPRPEALPEPQTVTKTEPVVAEPPGPVTATSTLPTVTTTLPPPTVTTTLPPPTTTLPPPPPLKADLRVQDGSGKDVQGEILSNAVSALRWEAMISGGGVESAPDADLAKAFYVNLVDVKQGRIVETFKPGSISVVKDGSSRQARRFSGELSRAQRFSNSPGAYRVDLLKNGEVLLSREFSVSKAEFSVGRTAPDPNTRISVVTLDSQHREFATSKSPGEAPVGAVTKSIAGSTPAQTGVSGFRPSDPSPGFEARVPVEVPVQQQNLSGLPPARGPSPTRTEPSRVESSNSSSLSMGTGTPGFSTADSMASDPSVQPSARIENYSGSITIASDLIDATTETGERRALILDLQFSDTAITGRAQIAGLGSFDVTGQVLARGLNLELRGAETQLRLSARKTDRSIRGIAAVPGTTKKGSFEVNLVQ